MSRFVALLTILFALATSAFATNTGFLPLNDLGSGLYLNLYQGGLYPGGSNVMPAAHANDGLSHVLTARHQWKSDPERQVRPDLHRHVEHDAGMVQRHQHRAGDIMVLHGQSR